MSNVTSSKLLDKEIAVLKANTNLSEQEIRETYEDFMQECPSGKMNKAQFNNFYKKMMASEDKDGSLCDHVFAVFDKNGDGSIDFSEFVLAVALCNKNDLDSTLELSFATLDTSRDGLVSFDEVVKFMDTAKKLTDDKNMKNMNAEFLASLIFGMFGIDKEQKINQQQFIDGCKNDENLKSIFGNS